MFSDSICEIIDRLFEETKHYNEEPFNYSLDFKNELIEILTNMYYIQIRLDNIELEKYKKSKIMKMAKERAIKLIERIEDGLDQYSDNEEEENTCTAEIIKSLKNTNKALKELDKKLDKHNNQCKSI